MKKSVKMSCEKEQYVENIGIYFEQIGVPRMAGRILGYLLICDPPHQSMQNIAEALQASKGAISTSSRMLIQSGIVDKKSFPKDRNDYFHIKSNAWSVHLKTQMSSVHHFKKVIRTGLKLLNDAPSDQKNRLQEMFDFYDWMDQEIPVLFERWEQYKNKTKKQ